MDIHFHTDVTDRPYDLALSECDSLDDLKSELAYLVQHAHPDAVITIALRPPVPSHLSIPLAFKTIVDLIKRQKTKQLSFHFCVESEAVVDHLYKYLPKCQSLTTIFEIAGRRISILTGDIVAVQTEAIVNAANTQLKLGGGVSGAIRRAARPSLQDELYRIAARQTIAPGDAILTGSYGIPGVASIIHAATADGSEGSVRQGIQNVLALCDAEHIQSVAFPALGTGVGGLSIEAFAEVFVDEVTAYYGRVQHILLVLWTKTDYDCVVERFSSRWS